MPIVIREIVSEVILEPAAAAEGAAADAAAVDVEDIVRRSTERVLEVLRREWDR